MRAGFVACAGSTVECRLRGREVFRRFGDRCLAFHFRSQMDGIIASGEVRRLAPSGLIESGFHQ